MNTFKQATIQNSGTTITSVGGYVVPSTTTTTIIGLTIANTTNATIQVGVSIYNGTTDTFILKNANIIAGQSQILAGGNQKIVIISGESIRVVSSAASSIDVIMSFLEMNTVAAGTGGGTSGGPIAFSDLTNHPTTLSGYGISDAVQATTNNINNLTDVTITSPTVGQILTWNGTQWVNSANAGITTLTTTTTAADQVVDSNSTALYSTIKYLIQVTSGSVYNGTEIIIVQDGTNAYINEYGTTITTSLLATFNAIISGSNVQLVATPVNANTTISFSFTGVPV